MKRRHFVAGAASLGAAAAVPALVWHRMQEIEPTIAYPGRAIGHALRDRKLVASLPTETRNVGIAIVGSGAAALCCAWKLAKAGGRDWLVIDGPEARGNLAGGSFDLADDRWAYPTGAHYLPLASRESTHVRELLRDLGTIESNVDSSKPTYDERVVVHAPDERVLFKGHWHEGLIPIAALDEQSKAEHQRFTALVAKLRDLRGSDGKRIFAVPIVASSQDAEWRGLDALTFDQWLTREGFHSSTLRWYLDYTCRDDYGTGLDAVSAWAGLHYHCSRGGQAANAHEGAVLTWPNGLATLAQNIERAAGLDESHRLAATAISIRERSDAVEIECVTADGRAVRIRANRVVVACPLSVAARLMPDLKFEPPQRSSWLIANFLMRGFPIEAPGAGLAWDNVVADAPGLGWVVSTHQAIRVARPARTVFTAYRAMPGAPDAARNWLDRATANDLLENAASDLTLAYGARFAPLVERALITVRAHAMAIPAPGFLDRPRIESLRQANGRVLFAHADLSGYSVFEEAAWWGIQAAQRLI